MTYIQTLTHDLELVTRLLKVIEPQDIITPQAKLLYNQLQRREEKYQRLIKAFHYEPEVGK